MMDFPYAVHNPAGVPVMRATEICRYPRNVELSLLDAGYTIRLYGKRITKTDLRKEKANVKTR